MSLKRYTKLLGLILALFISGSVLGQWDGLDPAFSPTGSGVSVNPILTMEFNGASSITLANNKTFYISKTDFSHYIELNTGSTPFPPRDSEITISGNTLTFDLSNSESLESGSDYMVIVLESDVISVDGSSYDGLMDYSKWNFTTEASIPPPSIQTYNPSEGASGVSISQVLELTFDEEIVRSSGSQFIHISHADDNTDFASFSTTNSNVSISGETLSITHANFTYDTEYYVIIESGYIENLNGGVFGGITSTTEWSFITEFAIPEWATGYPTFENLSKVGIDLLGQTNLDGDYYSVITQSATAPSEDQIKAGTDESDAAAVVAINGTMTADTEFSQTMDISGLTSESLYYVYTVAQDDENFIYSSINQYSFITQDTQAPSYNNGYPLATDIDGNSAKLESQINEDGHTYFVNLLVTDTPPSIQQVIDGQDGDGNPATYSGQGAIQADITVEGSLSGLDSETDYIAYVVTRDDNYNYIETTEPTQIVFSTLDVSAPIAIFDPYDGELDVTPDKVITITFNEAIYNSSAELIDASNVADIVRLRETNIIGSEVNTTITFDSENNIITIEPDVLLSHGMHYFVELDEVQDASGNISSASSSTFEIVIDPIPTTTFTPYDGETAVNVSSTIEVVYNQAIQNTDDTEITNANVASIVSVSYYDTGIEASLTYTVTISDDKTIITITPDNDLEELALVDVVIQPVAGLTGSAQSGVQSASFTTDLFVSWIGGTSDDFADATNWTDGYVDGRSVIISPVTIGNSAPIIKAGADLSANNIFIEAGASLEIEAGATFTVNKYLELQSSIDENVGNANLLIEGELNTQGAEISIQQLIARDLEGLYISSPVSFATQANSNITNSVWRRNAALGGSWELLSSSEVLESGMGYVAYGGAGETIEFTGDVTNSDVLNIDTYRTTSPNNFGWNLIGNPYPCSIDWDEVLLSDEMYKHFYILDNLTGIYGVYSQVEDDILYVNLNSSHPGHIPSCHAFWVQVDNDLGDVSGSVSIPLSARVNTYSTYLKSGSKSTLEHLRFKGVNSAGITDDYVVAFKEGADSNPFVYNSAKRFSDNNTVLQLYSAFPQNNYAIDVYSDYDEGRIINVGYRAGTEGNYSVKLSELANITREIEVILTDNTTGLNTVMYLDDEYEFYTKAGTFDDRFQVEIKPSIPTNNESIDEESILVYSVNNEVFVKLPELTNAKCKVYDMSGNLVQTEQLNSSQLNRFITDVNGMVIVKVISDERISSTKILIK